MAIALFLSAMDLLFTVAASTVAMCLRRVAAPFFILMEGGLAALREAKEDGSSGFRRNGETMCFGIRRSIRCKRAGSNLLVAGLPWALSCWIRCIIYSGASAALGGSCGSNNQESVE